MSERCSVCGNLRTCDANLTMAQMALDQQHEANSKLVARVGELEQKLDEAEARISTDERHIEIAEARLVGLYALLFEFNRAWDDAPGGYGTLVALRPLIPKLREVLKELEQ